MNALLQYLEEQPYVLLDGAMGTVLMQAGLEAGAPPEAWNLTYPDKIKDVHRRYVEAGSRLILTNSFGGTRFRLKLHNLQERCEEINRAAAMIARSVADEAPFQVIVGGSMGPTGELLAPLGLMSEDEARSAFAEQARGLTEGGVDLLWIETMSDLGEVRAAIEGARSVSELPLVATMTFDTNGHTMMGVSPLEAAGVLGKLDLAAIGGNCGNGPAEIESVIARMRQVCSDTLLVAKSNAGLPHWVDEQLIYDGTPEVMAEYALKVRALGARLIGACCGSTPDHVRAMALALESAEPISMDPGQSTSPASSTPPTGERSGRVRRFKRKER